MGGGGACGASPTRHRGRSLYKCKPKFKPEILTTRKELTGSADQEPGVGVAPAALHPLGTEGTPCTNQNFPTTAKEREKKKDVEDKSKGIEKVVKKKPKTIERDHDDCGESLKGLCEGFTCHTCDGYPPPQTKRKEFPSFKAE